MDILLLHTYGNYFLSSDLDVCYSSPCQNSGTCHNTGAGKFMCMCPPVFRGVTCEGEGQNQESRHGT